MPETPIRIPGVAQYVRNYLTQLGYDPVAIPSELSMDGVIEANDVVINFLDIRYLTNGDDGA